MSDSGYLTLEEIAQQLGISVKTVKEYLNEGKLNGERNPVSGSWIRVAESDFQEFLGVKPVEISKSHEKVGSDTPVEVVEAKQQTTLAKELTEKAKLQNEEHKAKIEMDLRQKGYDSIEDGLADADTKQKEALEMLEMSNKERAAVRAELEAVAREKQKAVNALAVVKERERMVNEKWADIMVKEENQKTFVGKYDTMRKELIGLVEYHKTHIIPCTEALRKISRTLYNYCDLLNNNTGYDWVPLYNYFGKQGKVIDNYVDHVENIIVKIKDEEIAEKQEP